jgi:microcystin-dependent protein
MAEPFLGELKIVAFDFPPKGWASCNGQLLPIAQNQALFSLLGTTYGGNGQTTFALPDLRARSPMHWGGGPALSSRTIGEAVGQAGVTLTAPQVPSHSHTLRGTSRAASTRDPSGALLAASTEDLYAAPGATVALAVALASTGGQPHENRQPFLALHFVIALQGIFPSRP